jgi:hypothetical protein
MCHAYVVTHEHVREKLGLKIMEGWRNDVVHRGRQLALSAEVERLLQCLVVDLIRVELGLENVMMLLQMAKLLGVDLSQLNPLSRGRFAK